MKTIRVAMDRFLRCLPKCNNWGVSIYWCLPEANTFLDAFVKDLWNMDKAARLVHKKTITQEQIKLLCHYGALGPTDSDDPAQRLITVRFYHNFYFRQPGKENKRQLKPSMIALRSAAEGKLFY